MGQLSVVSVEEKKGAENEVQLVLLSAPELLASRARQGQQEPKNMGSFTLVFVSSSMVKRRYHHQITGW